MVLINQKNCAYNCTYNHVRALKGLICGLYVLLKLVIKNHEPPSRPAWIVEHECAAAPYLDFCPQCGAKLVSVWGNPKPYAMDPTTACTGSTDPQATGATSLLTSR